MLSMSILQHIDIIHLLGREELVQQHLLRGVRQPGASPLRSLGPLLAAQRLALLHQLHGACHRKPIHRVARPRSPPCPRRGEWLVIGHADEPGHVAHARQRLRRRQALHLGDVHIEAERPQLGPEPTPGRIDAGRAPHIHHVEPRHRGRLRNHRGEVALRQQTFHLRYP